LLAYVHFLLYLCTELYKLVNHGKDFGDR
jgi:hypothetical protein